MARSPLPCQSHDADLWHSRGTANVARAVDLCNSCPIEDACRQYALTAQERQGVWGGLTEDERRQILGPPTIGRPAAKAVRVA